MNFIADKLNIFLVACSAFLAYLFPLELFIFAYAILGPLHYITEINWLNDKDYYFSDRSKLFLSISIVAALMLFVPKLYNEYGNMESTFGEIMLFVDSWSTSALFICLLFAIAYQFVSSKTAWIVTSIIGLIGSFLLKDLEYYKLIIGLFIPTIIHVYLFTIIFMLYGAKKSKSIYGYIAVILAAIAPIIYIYIPINQGDFLFNDSLKELYISNNFHLTPVLFSKFLGLSDGDSFYFYESLELKLMMFMSFIYCYHYLNWFSKTTVIKWHKMLNRKKSILIIVVWISSLLFYFIDFRLGFLISLFLSFLHVILELPLNILSIRGIFTNPK